MFNLAVCSFLIAVIPTVEVTPSTVTEMQGSDVKAVCSASGSPPPEILWNLDWLSTHHEVSHTASCLNLCYRSTTQVVLFEWSGQHEESFF